jgi:hypothetical protein
MTYEISELKKDYFIFIDKYGLPQFEELNENFEVEKIERRSDFLLRVIRKIVMEKVANSLSFVEMLLNPVNAPRMYFGYLKNLSSEDKKNLDEIYSKLSKLVVRSLRVEVGYSEEGEAELIKEAYKSWEEVKPKFRKIFDGVLKPREEEKKRERDYFG